MFNINKSLIIVFCFVWVQMLSAQSAMTLENAIEIALKNNHKIELKRLNVKISANNVDPAIVGKKPIVDINAGYQLGYTDASISTLALGPGQEENVTSSLNGISNNILITPEVRMVLIDGKASTFRLEQLETVNQLTQIALKETIEKTVLEVSNLYLEIARLTSQKKILQEGLDLTQSRYKQVVENEKYGLSNSLKSLQIEVEIKTDDINIRNIEVEIRTLKRNMNHLLGRDVEDDFLVVTQFSYNSKLNLAVLEDDLKNKNVFLEMQKRNIQIANYDFKISQSAFKPTLTAFGNVGFAYIQDNASFLQTNRTIGPTVGLRLNYPIFDGGARKIKNQNTKINIEKSIVEQDRLQEELITGLHNDFAVYLNSMRELETEQSNLPIFEKNLTHIQENFLMGLVTNTEVRNAQLSLSTLKNRINNYQYQIKQIELKLQFLTGNLVVK